MGDNTKEAVGLRLKDLRGKSTLEEISTRANEVLGHGVFDRQRLSKIERGKQTANYEDLAALAKVYAVSTDYLLGLSETRLPESMGAVEYTGLTGEAANYLHNLHVADQLRDKKPSSEMSMCEMISEFLYHSSGAMQNLYFLYHRTKDMSAFKPSLNALTGETDARMQMRTYAMANKYYGACKILSGKSYLLYEFERISHDLREAVAKTANLPNALKVCDTMARENAMREFEIIKKQDSKKEANKRAKKE